MLKLPSVWGGGVLSLEATTRGGGNLCGRIKGLNEERAWGLKKYQMQLALTTCDVRYHAVLWDDRSTGQL